MVAKDAGSGSPPLRSVLRRTQAPKRYVIVYVFSVVVFSISLVVLLVRNWGFPAPWEVVFFWAVLAVGDRLEVDAVVRGIPQAGLRARAPSLSAGFLVVLACAFATDPSTTAFLGFTAALVPSGWRGTLRTVFNGAQTAVYGGVASAIFVLVRAEFGEGIVWTLTGTAVASVTAEFANTAIVAGVLAIERRRGVVAVSRELAWAAPHSLAFAFLALLVGLLYRDAGIGAVIFILAPLFVLRQARQGKLELEGARAGTLRAFVSAVDLKSPWTSQHSANVASIAVDLHRVLGASEEELEKRYYGALLHDIGKVAVSGRILSKSDALADEEWEEMRRHPGAGAVVLNDVGFLRELVPEVLYHHERLDGSGYPSGLRGDEIPFEARVLAVADTFEALTSHRPYRDAFSHEEAFAEIQRCAGWQFDPAVVRALAELLDAGREFPVAAIRTGTPRETRSRPVARGA